MKTNEQLMTQMREAYQRRMLDYLDQRNPQALERLARDLGVKLIEDREVELADDRYHEEPERWDGGML